MGFIFQPKYHPYEKQDYTISKNYSSSGMHIGILFLGFVFYIFDFNLIEPLFYYI